MVKHLIKAALYLSDLISRLADKIRQSAIQRQQAVKAKAMREESEANRLRQQRRGDASKEYQRKLSRIDEETFRAQEKCIECTAKADEVIRELDRL